MRAALGRRESNREGAECAATSEFGHSLHDYYSHRLDDWLGPPDLSLFDRELERKAKDVKW